MWHSGTKLVENLLGCNRLSQNSCTLRIRKKSRAPATPAMGGRLSTPWAFKTTTQDVRGDIWPEELKFLLSRSINICLPNPPPQSPKACLLLKQVPPFPSQSSRFIGILWTWYRSISGLRPEMGTKMAETWILASPENGGKMARKMENMARKWFENGISGHFAHFPGHVSPHFSGKAKIHFSAIFIPIGLEAQNGSTIGTEIITQ